MTLQEYLASMGVTDPSQLRYRDATAGMGDLSRGDLADAGYSNSRFGPPSAGDSGYYTPSGHYIPAGDILRDGHTVYTIQQGANGQPAFSSHVDTPDLNAKDLAMMVAMTIGGAYGMNALGGLMGAGAGAAEGLGAGAANGMWDVLPEAVGSGGGGMAGAANGMWDFLPQAAGGAPNTAVMGAGGVDLGAANGMWDVLPEAVNPGAANGMWDFLPPEVSGLPPPVVPPVTPPGGLPNIPPVPPISPGSGDPTAYNYSNGSDINSDIATQTGVAPPGSVNAGIPTGGGPNISPLPSGTPTTPTSGLPGLPDGLGQILAPLLGGLLGSQPQTTTQKQDIPDWLKPYVIGDSTHNGILQYTNGLLSKQMAPGYMQGYEDMRSVGQGLLHTPQVGNQFSTFFPNPSAGYQPQMPAGSPMAQPTQGMQPQMGMSSPLMAPRRARPGIAY